MPCVYPAWAKKKTGCKLVTAPRGSLAANALKFGRFKKKVFSAIFQDAALRAVDMWHATCEKEYREIRAAGFDQPVAIVPIGIDIPEVSKRKSSGMRKLVFFGRIHRIKGCDKLVQAWERLCDKMRDWELVIAGPDCGALNELHNFVGDKNLPRVSFVGELNGRAKYEFLASADLYVLPTETENFGITVAEALASGTPVITTKGTLWSGLMGVDGIGRSGWWIDNTVDELVKAIGEAAEMDRDDLLAWGANGCKWMMRDYSWSNIGMQMKSAYEWLLGYGSRPAFVK
jgi:glycosyltransferase involved in cell wall biosynthesis